MTLFAAGIKIGLIPAGRKQFCFGQPGGHSGNAKFTRNRYSCPDGDVTVAVNGGVN
jgi:hypothetical protein